MEDFEKSFDNTQDKFYNIALRFLSFRPRSEKEIRDNFKRKKVGSQIIEKIVAKLKEQRFLNDEEFVKWWIEQRTAFKPRGLRLTKMELLSKGISNEIIDKMIYDLRFKNYDLERAKTLVEKRIERFRNLPKQDVYQKLGSYLARRGFAWETIKQSIDEAMEKNV